MLPKTVYESLPYFYLAIGIVEITCYQTLLTSLSGMLFFTAGAIMWVLRSDNRRRDLVFNRKDDYGVNRELYELKPFVYIVIGVLAARWNDFYVVHFGAVAFALYGLFVLIKRILYRHFKEVLGT